MNRLHLHVHEMSTGGSMGEDYKAEGVGVCKHSTNMVVSQRSVCRVYARACACVCVNVFKCIINETSLRS